MCCARVHGLGGSCVFCSCTWVYMDYVDHVCCACVHGLGGSCVLCACTWIRWIVCVVHVYMDQVDRVCCACVHGLGGECISIQCVVHGCKDMKTFLEKKKYTNNICPKTLF